LAFLLPTNTETLLYSNFRGPLFSRTCQAREIREIKGTRKKRVLQYIGKVTVRNREKKGPYRGPQRWSCWRVTTEKRSPENWWKIHVLLKGGELTQACARTGHQIVHRITYSQGLGENLESLPNPYSAL